MFQVLFGHQNWMQQGVPCQCEVSSMDVTLDEVSSVIRIVREVCDRWDDPVAWREHLLRGEHLLTGVQQALDRGRTNNSEDGLAFHCNYSARALCTVPYGGVRHLRIVEKSWC